VIRRQLQPRHSSPISPSAAFYFDAFSSREPVSTSLKNALDGDHT
jgi:hypothetical protein